MALRSVAIEQLHRAIGNQVIASLEVSSTNVAGRPIVRMRQDAKQFLN
jgi:hypothetical protein